MSDRLDQNDDNAIDQLLKTLPKTQAQEQHIDDAVLIAYRAQQLAEDRVAAIDDHLARCADCRDLLAAYASPAIAFEIPKQASKQASKEAKVLPFRRRAAVWAGAATLLAAAASLVLVLNTQTAIAPAPPYEIAAFEGMVQQTRGEPAPVAKDLPVFLPHSRVLLSLRPKEDLTVAAPHATVLLSHDGGALERAPANAIAVGEGGAVRVSSRASDLFGERFGRWNVVVVLSNDPHGEERWAGRSPADAKSDAQNASWLAIELRYEKEIAQ